MLIAWMCDYCRELEWDTFWASVENVCPKARVEPPQESGIAGNGGIEYRLLHWRTPSFMTHSDILNTKNVTQEAIS